MCAAQALDILVQLNHNRIYGRLGSRKYSQPRHRRGPSPQPLTDELRRLFTRTPINRAYDRVQREVLLTEIDALHHAFRQMEELSECEDSDAIKDFLEQAYKITVDGVSLMSRLKASGFPDRCLNCKQVRQLMKLANYTRTRYSLAEKARSLRERFISLELRVLEPYGTSLWQGRKRFVHAEIQILIHYMNAEVDLRPRVIGASKEACFLCDSFVRAHGDFYLSKAHRQLYDKWTIPDLKGYDTTDRERLQNTLEKVNEDVTHARATARDERIRRPYPLQSTVNLLRAVVREASMSTIRSFPSPHNESVTPGLIVTQKQGLTPPRYAGRAMSSESVHSYERSRPNLSLVARSETPSLLVGIEPMTAPSVHLKDSAEQLARESQSGSVSVVSSFASPSDTRTENTHTEANGFTASQPEDRNVSPLKSIDLQREYPNGLSTPVQQMCTAPCKDQYDPTTAPGSPKQRNPHRARRSSLQNPVQVSNDRCCHHKAKGQYRNPAEQALYKETKRRVRHTHRSAKVRSSSAQALRRRRTHGKRGPSGSEGREYDAGCLGSLLSVCIHALCGLFSR